MIGCMMERARTPQSLAGMPADTPVLLAFSGGADSAALLHRLSEWAQIYGFSLTLAHVNHGIRGEEALRDRTFCEACAEQYGLEICVLDADVPRLAGESGKGIEETAREVRYAYFERLMRERQIPLLATAHHADDNLETVLFRLARGTGVKGLSGIASARRFAGGTLTRPFLQVTKQEILAYCEANGVPFVTDGTNADPTYARNRIRMEVLPILEELFPGASRRVSRTAEELSEISEYLDAMGEALLQSARHDAGLGIEALVDAPAPLRKRALYLFAERACGSMIEAVHMDALLALCADPNAHAEVALPHDMIAFCERGMLCVGKRMRDAHSLAQFHIPLSHGVCDAGVTGIRVFAEKCENGIKVHNLSTAPYIILKEDFDIINKTLFWRLREDGDEILMGGMHRMLRRLQARAQIPVRLRDKLPLLCDAEGIVWAPFVGVRDGVSHTTEPTADGFMVGILLPNS
ncbi:MAG: tRNA lysidine(34) synthetase TilS [Clostridia bacterium]|nr:tRNA lysidine(34) synthetase TilS [Clostridia bacterium]